MMPIDIQLKEALRQALAHLFQHSGADLPLQPTNAEFEGSHTAVCFMASKMAKKSPEETARMIGEYLVEHSGLVRTYNVVKGFLNLTIEDRAWVDLMLGIAANSAYGVVPQSGKEVMIEFSSPNTNKPLHLGHLRNNFLGHSVASLLKASGYSVHSVQIVNDRGIHICKSMAAWMVYGNGETPESVGVKGDHLVGKYYVAFDKQLKKEVAQQVSDGRSEEVATKESPMMKMAVGLLQKWEAKDPQVMALWKTMNGWVYEGFNKTYERMGVSFDKLYYESNTYLLGKEEVQKGLEEGVFYKKDDGSVWVDLTDRGLDHKLLLRADGTSVYMTQDIGTAILRFQDFPKIEGQIYTVGNEQEHHFKVLFAILGKLGYDWAEKCIHLSYGMVDLPSGKMKSREGTVVDADVLMEEVVAGARQLVLTLGKMEKASEKEIDNLSRQIGLGALKFFLLKVDPKKRMLFDPAESIKLQGHTGPFVQYTHARIYTLLARSGGYEGHPDAGSITVLHSAEREIIHLLGKFPDTMEEATRMSSPAVIANYAFDLAKAYNHFYQSIQILSEPDQAVRTFRLILSKSVASVIRTALQLLGIESPERM